MDLRNCAVASYIKKTITPAIRGELKIPNLKNACTYRNTTAKNVKNIVLDEIVIKIIIIDESLLFSKIKNTTNIN